MDEWIITYWTGKTETIKGDTLRAAYVAAGYPADPDNFSAHLWEITTDDDGAPVEPYGIVTNRHGDQCCTITRKVA